MSILQRQTSHLDDAVFAELWTNALADGTAPAGHPHLQACAECRVRFASFSAWMNDLRTDAADEAHAALPPERLAAQQAQIFRRLEAAERPARVIAFPHFRSGGMRPSPVRRWIAAAAAAGLIIGIGLGQVVNLRQIGGSPSSGPVERRAEAPAPRGPVAVPALAVLNEEDTVLEELEAYAMPRYEALRAYETFTPRAADFQQPR